MNDIPPRIVPVSEDSGPWGRLLADSRIPRRRKLLLGFAAVYAASPIDLIPEALFPVVGHVDDVLLLVFSINHLLNSAPPSLLREYWDGDPEALELVYGVISWVGELMPEPLRRTLLGD